MALTLSAKIRKKIGKGLKALRKQGSMPAVLYGPKIEPVPLKIDRREFEKVYEEAGESSLVSLKIGKKQSQVLIHDVQEDPLTSQFLHVDFYQPALKGEVTAHVPLVFEGTSLAVKDLGGTLVKTISEIEVRGLAQELPKEIKVNIEALTSFEDAIHVKDLEVNEKIEILKEPEEIVAQVVPPEKEEVEEEAAPAPAEAPTEAPVGKKKEKE